MNPLSSLTCEACKAGAPQATDAEQAEFLEQLPDWQLDVDADVKRLKRVFSFDNFQEALAFTVKVGDLAESHDHHPQLITEWGCVTVIWWTHKIQGLHRNDFIMAAKTDNLFQ